MNKILEKTYLHESVVKMVFEAPEIAKKRKAGQFIVLMIDDKGERIPLTIVDSDAEKGTLTIIFQVVGKTTADWHLLNAGDSLAHVLGPLGHPTEIENFGTAICVGGGVGVGVIYPIAAALKKAGNKVISIIGSRTKDLLILEKREWAVSDELIVCDRRRELRFPWVCQRGPSEPDRQGDEDRPRLRDRPRADDAGHLQCHQALWH